MFTLEQLGAAHSKVKSGADFPAYVQEIKAMGLAHYDFYVTDGHSEYFAQTGEQIDAPAKYPVISIAEKSDAAALRHTIQIHQKGETNFATFCQQAADAGVVYWRTDAMNLVCNYVDASGQVMLAEPIPDSTQY